MTSHLPQIQHEQQRLTNSLSVSLGTKSEIETTHEQRKKTALTRTETIKKCTFSMQNSAGHRPTSLHTLQPSLGLTKEARDKALNPGLSPLSSSL